MLASQTHSEAGLKERFFRSFQEEAKSLQERIEQLSEMSVADGKRNDAVDHCLADIDRLSHEVKDASSYIPAYDQRAYSETIKALAEKLQSIRNSFNPAKKFSFKTRKNISANQVNDAVEIAQSQKAPMPAHPDRLNTNASFVSKTLDKFASLEKQQRQEAALGGVMENEDSGKSASNKSRSPQSAQSTNITITGHEGLRITPPSSELCATRSGTVANLNCCIIDLSPSTANGAPLAALYLKKIKNSLVICGQVAGAVHITDMEHSVMVVACRQFRMHGSKNVDIYLHSTSRPIFEDCEGLRFAPLPDAYMTPAISQSANQWDQIDDFKWLKAEASPHFSILSESDRVRGDVWYDKVLGDPASGVDDILKAVIIR